MAKKKTKQTAKTKATKHKQTEGREVIYPKPRVSLHTGDKALTAAQSKTLLGWEEEGDDQFETDYLLKDARGKKVRCHNNIKNRPFSTGNCNTFVQEILRGRWRFNMENRIIGETGLLLNGQHTLVALVLANQAWEKDPDRYDFWETAPTIETSIALGAPEDSHTVDTLDTCRPRSLSDVLFRGPFFADVTVAKDRKAICRIADYAVKLCWSRLGIKAAYEIRQTHSESINFLERHPRLVEAVQFIHDENGTDRKVSRFISPGIAAGLLYLMGSAKTEPRKYHQADNPTEDLLDWELWDKACDFWALLAGMSEQLQPLTKALGKLIQDEDSSQASKTATVVTAWALFLSGKKLTVLSLGLKYETDKNGIRTLVECPVVGGIDLGDGEWESEATPQDPTPQEIQSRASSEREKTAAKKTAAKKTAKKKTAKKKVANSLAKKGTLKKEGWDFGDKGWLTKLGNESKQVKIISLIGSQAVVRIEQGFPGAGATEKIEVGRLTRMCPNHVEPDGPAAP